MDAEQFLKEDIIEEEYNESVNETAQETAYEIKTDNEYEANTNEEEYVSEEEELNLHLSEDSNQQSDDYEVIEYDPNNAFDFCNNSRLSENSESSDKEHSFDDSMSTDLAEEGHSSYEELTSQDELEDPTYKVYEVVTLPNNQNEIEIVNTQDQSSSSYSNRVVADKVEEVETNSRDLEFKMWQKLQTNSDKNTNNDQKPHLNTNIARCIKFPDTNNDYKHTNIKTEIVDYSNVLTEEPILSQETLKYESLNPSDSFETNLKRAKDRQKAIEAKMYRLLKSLTMLNVRNMAKHMSNEVANLHEYIYKKYNSKQETIDICDADAFQPTQQTFSDYNAMLSEIQNFNMSQETALSRQKHHNKYFGAGSSAYQMHPKCIAQTLFPPLDPKDAKSIKEATKHFGTQLRLLETTMDSDATESSSSDESGYDEGYNNEHQKHVPLSKRTSTQLMKLENTYVSRLRWIQLHVTFLESKKKYHDYIHTVLQSLKSQLKFIDNDTKESRDVNTLPSIPENDLFSCARIRPLDVSCFKKRKLVQTANLHTVSMSAAQTCTLRCGCQWPYQPCALCTGRVDPTAPRVPSDCLDLPNKLALLEPGMHPNLSVLSEVPQNIHFNSIMKLPEWQAKMIRCGPRIKTLLAATSAADRRMLKEELKCHDRPRKFIKKPIMPGTSSSVVKPMKHGFKKRGRKPSSSKSGKRRKMTDFDDHYDSSLSTNMSEESQTVATTWTKESRADRPTQRSTSFDIDNMVIPYGVPITTKVQVLPYKEIITPKWRVVDYDPLLGGETLDEPPTSNIEETRVSTSSYTVESDEDVSEETALKRHARCLLEERKKFGVYTKLSWTTRSRANRRLESKTMDMMPVTPQSEHTSESEMTQNLNETTEFMDSSDMNIDPSPEYTYTMERMNKRKSLQSTSQGSKDLGSDVDTVTEVLPFSTRPFPLTEDDYDSMVSVMPAKHTEILSIMQSSTGDDLLRQSLTESENLDMNVTSPYSEVVVKKEKTTDTGVIGHFPMSDSEDSLVALDDPDDPEWG